MRKIDPSEYMVDGWDSVPDDYVNRYKRGSRHNKIGMTIMWSYYILIIGMIVRLIAVLSSN